MASVRFYKRVCENKALDFAKLPAQSSTCLVSVHNRVPGWYVHGGNASWPQLTPVNSISHSEKNFFVFQSFVW